MPKFRYLFQNIIPMDYIYNSFIIQLQQDYKNYRSSSKSNLYCKSKSLSKPGEEGTFAVVQGEVSFIYEYGY